MLDPSVVKKEREYIASMYKADWAYRKATPEERRDIKQMLRLVQQQPRRKDFEPYREPFRSLNEEEIKSFSRAGMEVMPFDMAMISELQVSYQALPGGFTICNILLNQKLYSGCSHCIKSDRWLPIRGKMNAFRRALEQSEGVELPQEKYFMSEGFVYSADE